MILSLILFGLGIACYSIKELQAHGKLKWMPSSVMSFGHASFWGSESWKRKYKHNNGTPIIAPSTWYYRFFKIKYKERFPLSATFLVSLTDGYHLTQSLMFIFFSLSLSLATDINFFWIWGGLLFVHFSVYRLLQK